MGILPKWGLGIAASINIILIILALFMVNEGYKAYRRIKAGIST